MPDDPLQLSSSERVRYARHFALPTVGVSGQAKLKAAKQVREATKDEKKAKAVLMDLLSTHTRCAGPWGYVSHKAPKDSVSVDYTKALLEAAEVHGFSAMDFIKNHTTVVPKRRRLNVYPAKGGKK